MARILFSINRIINRAVFLRPNTDIFTGAAFCNKVSPDIKLQNTKPDDKNARKNEVNNTSNGDIYYIDLKNTLSDTIVQKPEKEIHTDVDLNSTSTNQEDSHQKLFIYGVPSSISSRHFYSMFRKIGRIRHHHLVNTGNLNFGFITYVNKQDAERAIKVYNGYKILNNYLKVSFKETSTGNSKPQTFLHLFNLPHTMTREELKKLFSSYGEVSYAEVYTEKKLRGYGRVRFNKATDADSAFIKLNGTILDGGEKPLEMYFYKFGKGQQTFDLHVQELEENFPRRKLFRLFSFYGPVVFVKFINESSAIIGFKEFVSAKMAKDNLNNTALAGAEKKITVDFTHSTKMVFWRENEASNTAQQSELKN